MDVNNMNILPKKREVLMRTTCTYKDTSEIFTGAARINS